MLRPGRGHHNPPANGYYGAGTSNSSRSLDLGYDSLSPTSEYKDKPRRRTRWNWSDLNGLPLWLIPAAVAFFLAVLSYNLYARHAFLLKQMNVKHANEAIKLLESIRNEKSSAERELKRYTTLERVANAKNDAAEKNIRTLLKDRDELRIKYEGPERKEAEKRIQAQLALYENKIQHLENAVQKESKRAVLAKYGSGPYKVQFFVALPDSSTPELNFTIEMAPLELMPHSVHLFLEQVDYGLWNNSWFIINGPHVLQCGPYADEDEDLEVDERTFALQPFHEKSLDSLAFTEYSPQYPHVPWTLGFTGRPGGPDWYINKQDNTVSHGPRVQSTSSTDPGDPCFAKVIDGQDSLQAIFNRETIQEGELVYFFDEPVHIVKAIILGERLSQIRYALPNAEMQKDDLTTSNEAKTESAVTGEQGAKLKTDAVESSKDSLALDYQALQKNTTLEDLEHLIAVNNQGLQVPGQQDITKLDPLFQSIDKIIDLNRQSQSGNSPADILLEKPRLTDSAEVENLPAPKIANPPKHTEPQPHGAAKVLDSTKVEMAQKTESTVQSDEKGGPRGSASQAGIPKKKRPLMMAMLAHQVVP